MRVALFVTCLVDQLWPSAGAGAVTVLRRVGCSVEFDEAQTCCGQPAFNTGYRKEARALAARFIEILEASSADAIVSPSGSCTAMVHHYEDLFAEPRWKQRARAVAERTYELSSFLVNRLGVEDVGASFSGRLTWHDACHGLRELGIRHEPRRLLHHVRGVELVEVPGSDTCCGFGGTFSVKYPEISVAMLDQKLSAIEAAGVDAVVAGDASCLMQIEGRLTRTGSRVRALHLAEVLAATGNGS
jgi:L-lactate dehydrogenase complex protein LldE